ncbi:hypothetical protein ACF0H5_009141 [Mactra antiquata]
MEGQHELNARYARSLLPVTITFGVFTVVGVVGNIIVLLVFALGRAYRNNNFRVFVISLAIIDLLTSAFLIPAEIIKHRNFFSFGNIAMCKIKCLFNVWAACAAALSLLIISIDRYRKVCQPLRKQIGPQLAMRLCVFLSFFVSIILSVPGAVMCGIKRANMTDMYVNQTTTVFVCETEDRFKDHILRTLYKYNFILLLVGVSIACIVMYILIGLQIARHWGSVPTNFRKDSGKDQNSDFTSETFGKMKSGSDNREKSDSKVSISTNITDSPTNSPSPSKPKRPPLVRQGTSVDDEKAAKKRLVKQLSAASAGSRDDGTARRRNMSRSASGFGLRKFPYKTLIWFILTLVFIITYILYLGLSTKTSQLTKMDVPQFTLFQSFYRLYFINNIINPIVYALLDKNFRKATRTLGPRIKQRFRDGWFN